MTFYSFDDYWKRFGKLHESVIKNDRQLEKDFYELAKTVWEEANSEISWDAGYSDGWDACENHFDGKE